MATEPMTDPPLPRMRIERGRVMHQVREQGDRYVSMCTKPSGIKGLDRRYPRAQAPKSDWTTKRYWYEDCKHCPADADE